MLWMLMKACLLDEKQAVQTFALAQIYHYRYFYKQTGILNRALVCLKACFPLNLFPSLVGTFPAKQQDYPL